MYFLHRLFRKYLLAIVVLLTIVTLMISLHYSKTLPAQTYYQLSSRVFEFLIGSCIALIPARAMAMKHYISDDVFHVIGAWALITIFYIASLDHILLGYPNWYAFGVCVATALLIVIGKFNPSAFSVKVLSLKPLVFIGLLSYSLYIWHWAVFAVLRYQSVVETPGTLLITYGLIFIIAYLSWKYIEKPARRFKTIKFRYTVVCLLLVPILLTHISAYLIKFYGGFPQRFNQELVTVYQQLDQYSSKERPSCMSTDNRAIESQCTVGSKKMNSKTGLMIGDSFSNHYWGFMDTLGNDAGVSILAQGASSCITLPGIYLFDWWHFKNQVYQACHDSTEQYFHMIQSHHYDYVIIGQLWSNYWSDNIINNVGDERSLELTKTRLEAALDKALDLISASGAKPVLINTSALMQENFHDCFFKHIKLRQPYDPEQCRFNFILSDADQWFDQLFAKMKIKYPALILIDPKKVQCQNGRCMADINGIPVYRDIGHITDYASYQLGKLYLKEFHNPLV